MSDQVIAQQATEPDIATQSAMFRSRKADPRAVVDGLLDKADAANPALNAFITITRDLARHQAAASAERYAAGTPLSPLDGIAVAVKDFYDTAGIATTAGFRHFRHRVPEADAAMVTRLRDAGAVLIGKTNMDALGMATTGRESAFGPVANPWSGRHVTGGSSSGSAVAVATGLCFATVDTDAAGSARLPAAICGLAGFKPSYGVLSGEGILAGEPADPAILALAHVALQARTAADVALVFETLSQRSAVPKRDPIRIAAAANIPVHAQMQEGFDAAMETLAEISVLAAPVTLPLEMATFDISAVEEHRAAADDLMFAACDVVVLPTLAEPAPTIVEAERLGASAVRQDNVFFANYFGLPAITVPMGTDSSGVPTGLQLVGRAGKDELVLALARAFQAAYADRVPAPFFSPSNQ
ncbi:MAG: amidase [Rhizobiaceae bacterium]